MKRIVCLVLSAVLLLGLIGVGASAEGKLQLVVTGGTAAPGETVEVVLSAENNPGLKGIHCLVDYDDTVLIYKGYEALTPPPDEDGNQHTWSYAKKTHDLMWYFDGITEDYQMMTYDDEGLIKLRFQVAEDAAPGEYPVTLKFESSYHSVTVVRDNYTYSLSSDEYEIVAGSVTVPGSETLEDGYYLIGQNGWTVDDIDPEQKFVSNPSNSDEFLLETNLAEGDGIKVVKVENGAITGWYPDGVDNQYIVDKAHSGTKTIYFHPWYADGWADFGGYIWIDAPVHTAEVYGSSLSLKGDIGLNFFLILPGELQQDTGAYVILKNTADGTSMKLMISEATTRTVDDNGTQIKVYQFSVKLAAKQMTEKVELRVYNGEGEQVNLVNHTTNENVTETGYLYSVQDYVEKVHANSTDAKLIALVDAMLDYGALAQINFNYNTGNIPEVKANLDEVTADTLAKYQEKVTVGTVPGLTYYGTSLVTESTTEINVYFTPDEGSELADFTFKVGTKVYTPVEKDGMWMIKIPNIAAKDLDKSYTVTVSTAEGKVVTVKTCALSYAYKVVNKGTDEALVNLVKGLYLYNQAANAYFG
ncbi:MAG: hypothetical protein IJK63_12050 [Oscillospiraceae bacterium]|nr:hypothetical protein [Oscillospiraceae bacterium]